MDVRPAVDSVTALFDRLRMFPSRAMEAWNKPRPVDNTPMVHTPPPTVAMALRGSAPATKPGAAATDATPADADAAPSPEDELRERVHTSCGKYLHDLEVAQGDQARTQASMGLMLCMGKHLCADQTAKFRAALSADDDDQAAARYEEVVGCLATKREFFASLTASHGPAAGADPQKLP